MPTARYVAALLIVAATLAPVASSAADWPKYKIKVTDFKDDTVERDILTLAAEVEQEVGRVTEFDSTYMELRIVPGKGFSRGGPQLLVMGWPENLPEHEILPRLTRALLLRRMLQYNPKLPPDPAMVPEWLVACITYRIREHGGQVVTISIYPAIHAAVLADSLPTAESMIEQAPTPADTTIYMVYGQFATVLMRSIQRSDRKAIETMLKNYDPEADPYEALVAALPETARRNTPTAWFRRRLEIAGVWHLMPASYEYAEAELATLQSISIMAPGEGGVAQVKTIDLKDLTKESLNYSHTSGAFSTLNYKLQNLQSTGPPLLRAAAAKYTQAIAYFQAGEMKQFHAALAAAREWSDSGMARGKAILQVLDTYEYGPDHSPHLRLARMLPLVLHDLEPAPYEQRVSAYLDSLEAHATIMESR